ncbi:TetR/AcrR family transcriptional regulator [Oceanicella sp. SM1341]|uniref:TetR/AcrR family transcriptional regulator n=1 Tax=Oceanicella sp. SM1341 TaxID=1548889 RepID=UPI001E3D09A3|nr:TetR/AcrR family transcriptional regulator [Oceanicella sp. SM1341]
MKIHILDSAKALVAARGFSGVGLSEIVAAAGVPKGSFYYYFESKEAFGRALLEHYFEGYLAELETMLADEGKPARERLQAYWRFWRTNQEGNDPEGKCLAVKLGAEVSDISEDMRLELRKGTSRIVSRLCRTLRDGLEDGSVESTRNPFDIAETLYQLWLGASVMAKIERKPAPFDAAMIATDLLLSGK